MSPVKRNIFLLIIVFAFSTNASLCQKVFDIMAYGAKADGVTNNTISIQKAIDEASASGKGRVLVPAGKFVTGVITLKSNVDLHLADGAVLLGSPVRLDYGPKNASALIVADGQKNISITGKGTIDGNGAEVVKDTYRMLEAGRLQDEQWKTVNPWGQLRPAERNRPEIIEFLNSDNILVKGVSIINGACWIQDYNNCTNVILDSIKVVSNTYWNNDGIDIVDCKDVRITNSFVNCDDDGICLKSSNRKSRCENIYIGNCTVRSSASALKFGTASWGGFKNVTVRDITVYDTYRSAIALEAVDGGVLEDIDIRNVKATNTGNAIFIRLGHRNKDSVISSLRNVYIANVKAEIPIGKPDRGYPMEGPVVNPPHNLFPASITGIPGHAIQNVKLENIEIVYGGDAKKETAFFATDTLERVPEREADYPEFSMFGELPASAFYVRHATGIEMNNVKISYKKSDFRTAFVFDDVDDLKLQNLKVSAVKGTAAIILNKVSNPKIDTSVPKGAIKISGRSQTPKGA